MSRSNRLSIALLLCFFLSGATSLTLEIVWVRLFSQIFGSTNLAIATVLAVFMGGMALGSWLGGTCADRQSRDPMWLYALCEFGIAVSALVVPWFLATFPEVNAWLWGQLGSSPIVLSIVRALLCALLLIVPTTFMGATLPILSKAVVRTGGDFQRLGSTVATLYAANTAGAVSGAIAAGFWLLPELGLSRLHSLAVGSAISIAFLAALIALRRNWQPETADLFPEPTTGIIALPSDLDAYLALFAFAVSGGTAMALEGLFSRAMALVLGSAIQSFTLVLVLFLLGLSVGAGVVGRMSNRAKDPMGWLALILTSASVALLIVYSYIDLLPSFHHALVRWADIDLRSMGGIFLRGLVVLSIAPVTFFLGAVMPLAIRAYARSQSRVGSEVGRAYSINTLGAVAGSLLGGFVILPGVGIGKGLLISAFVLAAVALILSLRASNFRLQWTSRGLAMLSLLGFMVLPTLDVSKLNSGMFAFLGNNTSTWANFQKNNELVYSRDGRSSTIAVFENQGSFALLNNGKPDGSSAEDVHTQVLLGMLPAILHPGPIEKSFVIGYGTGMTVGALTRASHVDHIDVVEIEEAVYEAADAYFSDFSHAPEKNPSVKRYIGDGRNFLMHRAQDYNLIVSEPPDIWVSGVASLFSHEFYTAVAQHLKPGGLFCQWVPLYHLSPDTVKIVYRTLRRTFSNVQVFVLSNGNSIVIASQEALAVSMQTLEERMSVLETKMELARADIRFPAELLALFALGAHEIDDFVGGGTIHSDDNGVLEFAAQDDYLFSVRSPANAADLKRQLQLALEPYGDIRHLGLDLGEGLAASRRADGLANIMLRAGRETQAAFWREEAKKYREGGDGAQ